MKKIAKLIMLFLFLLVSLFIFTMSEPIAVIWDENGVWEVSVPNALLDCSRVTQLELTLDSITVTKTPNDAGSYEEWKLEFDMYDQTFKVNINPRDNIGEDHGSETFTVNKTVIIPLENKPYTFVFLEGKHESDGWPWTLNPNDSIPRFRLLIVKPCMDEPVDTTGYTGVGSGNIAVVSAKNDNGKRKAQFHFSASIH